MFDKWPEVAEDMYYCTKWRRKSEQEKEDEEEGEEPKQEKINPIHLYALAIMTSEKPK